MKYIIQAMNLYICENHGNKSKCHFKFTNNKKDATLFELQELAFYVRDILEMYKDNVNASIHIIPVDE